MAHHYGLASRHGIARARDGLPWRHDPVPRLAAARDAGLSVVWDLTHFDPPPDPVGHARRVALGAAADRPLWICPVNEPSLSPRLCGMGLHDAVRMGIEMVRVAKDHHPDVRVLVTDPITGIGDRQFAATDALVGSGFVDVVGVNYYPHTRRAGLAKVLTKTARRYRLPVMVAETSWHDGHPVHRRLHPEWRKGDWLRHVLGEIEVAVGRGAAIAGLCWYPFVDCPPWNAPRSHRRWSHGLIRGDGDVDPHLSAALHERHAQPRGVSQLMFDYGEGTAGAR